MEYILLCLASAGVTFQSFMSKQFNTKAKATNPYFYTAISAFVAMIFFVISSGGKLNFSKEILPYSVAFGVAYGITIFSTVKAMKYGPLSITALISTMALAIPTAFGIIVLNDPIGVLKYTGIALLILALVLINLKKENDKKVSPKWVLFVSLTFFGNGSTMTLQKIQQMTFDGAYKSEYMIIALAIVCISLFVLGLCSKGDKGQMMFECVKYAAPAGVANGMVNLLVMVLTAMLPTAVLFPSISAIDMVLTFVIALLIFRERISKIQTIGYIIGIMSVIMLNM